MKAFKSKLEEQIHSQFRAEIDKIREEMKGFQVTALQTIQSTFSSTMAEIKKDISKHLESSISKEPSRKKFHRESSGPSGSE